MNMGRLFAKIVGFLTIIVTLALAPTINTANAAIVTAVAEATNNTSIIGMSIVGGNSRASSRRQPGNSPEISLCSPGASAIWDIPGQKSTIFPDTT